MDATDRNKEEESKRFKSHNIELDFSVLVRIKESMVDLSSNCIEIAIKVKFKELLSGCFILTMFECCNFLFHEYLLFPVHTLNQKALES